MDCEVNYLTLGFITDPMCEPENHVLNINFAEESQICWFENIFPFFYFYYSIFNLLIDWKWKNPAPAENTQFLTLFNIL